MDLQFFIVRDPGDKEKERVVLKVMKNTELGNYLIATATENDDNKTISSSLSNVLWLPDQKLKAGDLVVIYTYSNKKGKTNNIDGSTSYFYTWGLKKPVGDNKRNTIVLFETDWCYRRVFPEEVKVDELLEK